MNKHSDDFRLFCSSTPENIKIIINDHNFLDYLPLTETSSLIYVIYLIHVSFQLIASACTDKYSLVVMFWPSPAWTLCEPYVFCI